MRNHLYNSIILFLAYSRESRMQNDFASADPFDSLQPDAAVNLQKKKGLTCSISCKNYLNFHAFKARSGIINMTLLNKLKQIVNAPRSRRFVK